LIADGLAWERAQGLDRPRGAGLSAHDEAQLRAAWAEPSQDLAEPPV
jgi:hypothetical protein